MSDVWGPRQRRELHCFTVLQILNGRLSEIYKLIYWIRLDFYLDWIFIGNLNGFLFKLYLYQFYYLSINL